MTNKDLRKFTRQELLELLVQQKQQYEALQAKNAELEAELENRSLQIENAGSMAEAAFGLNQVFETADKAASEYLENVKRRSEEMDEICAQKLAEANAEAETVVADARQEALELLRAAHTLRDEAEQKAADTLSEAEQKAADILSEAEAGKQRQIAEIDAYWDGLKGRLENFYQSHTGLKEMLESSKQPQAQ